MSFQRPSRPPAKQIGEGYTLGRARPAARGQGLVSAVSIARASVPLPTKTPDRVSNAIRKSANGEQCTVRLPGCPGDPDLTIWSHNRHQRAGKGLGIKALDLNGAYACGCFCDAIYDGQMPLPSGLTREAVELAWYHGHAESLVKLRQKGLI